MRILSYFREVPDLKVKDCMTRAPRTLSSKMHVITARKLMSKENIRHIPVVEGGEPIGIVTARDLDHYHLVYKDVDFNKEVTLGQLCLSAPYTVDENTALVKVLPFMREHKYGSVLITSNNALTGIITLIDICKTLEQVLCREI